MCVCVFVCLFVRGWRPNDWTDRHQTWHGHRGTSHLKYGLFKNDVTKPEVTSHGVSLYILSVYAQTRRPIATKPGTELERQPRQTLS